MHQFHPSILGKHDVRGIIGKTLSAEDAYAIGQPSGRWSSRAEPQGRVCVGRDGRLFSPGWEEPLVEGLPNTQAILVAWAEAKREADVKLRISELAHCVSHTGLAQPDAMSGLARA